MNDSADQKKADEAKHAKKSDNYPDDSSAKALDDFLAEQDKINGNG